MFKKFTGINMQMDEMLLSKQNQVGMRCFWWLLLLSYAVFMVQSLGFDEPFRVTWPAFTLCLGGTVLYVLWAFRANIPILPPLSRRTLGWLVIAPCVVLGVFVGIRNIFFLYAANVADWSMGQKLLMTGQIALMLTVETIVLNLLSLGGLVLLTWWQNRRIERQIALENEED